MSYIKELRKPFYGYSPNLIQTIIWDAKEKHENLCFVTSFETSTAIIQLLLNEPVLFVCLSRQDGEFLKNFGMPL